MVTYQGITATAQDIEDIKKLIAESPQASRWCISRELCKKWGWYQPNGVLRDMVCRGFLLCLDRAGHITLPPKKRTPVNYLANRRIPPRTEIDQTPLETTVAQIKPLEIQQVRYTPQEKLFNSLIAHYHYLGYCHPVGEHLKYLVYHQGRPIACFAWSSAPRHIGSRDRFIGWPAAVRTKNLHLIAYNSRFLIFNWIRVPHLASHLLSRMAKILPTDWQRIYNHPLYFLETFVDTEKFKGTCYKSANWQFLGLTTGRGKNGPKKPNRSLKAVWGYPLTRDFRKRLWQ